MRIICSNFDSLYVFVQIKAANYRPFTIVLTDEEVKMPSLCGYFGVRHREKAFIEQLI